MIPFCVVAMETALSAATAPNNVETSSPTAAARTRSFSKLCWHILDSVELWALSIGTVVTTQHANTYSVVDDEAQGDVAAGLFHQQTALSNPAKLVKAACAR